jgi:hypothetical protein
VGHADWLQEEILRRHTQKLHFTARKMTENQEKGSPAIYVKDELIKSMLYCIISELIKEFERHTELRKQMPSANAFS